MNRREFLTTCACCSLASFGAVYLNELGNTGDFFESRIQIHLAEHCNLKCKYCLHFSCIAQEEYYNLEKFQRDIEQLSLIYNKKLSNLLLLGGEPLLNPQINEYVKISRKYFPEAYINITTNAVLLDEMDEKFWKTLNENNIPIIPSIYPVKINWKSILDKARKYNVSILEDRYSNNELTLEYINEHRVTLFDKMILSKHGKNADKSKCPARFACNCMQDGRIYPCFAIAYIRHFNKKFNTDFLISEGDYLDLYKIKKSDEIKSFLTSDKQFPFCKYCTIKAGRVKWENSSVHTISEWT